MATNINQITAPRVDFLDSNTGKISREWYMFLYNLYTITGAGTGITAVVNGGTGLGTIPTNGQLLIGNGTGYALNTLGTGVGISVINGAGTITVANTGVLSNIAGTGISVSGTTGNVTISNTGVLSWSGGSTGLTPAAPTTGAITLGGLLAIGYGGTNGIATPTAGAIAYGTGSAYAFSPSGTIGQVLTSGGISTPTWTTPTTGTVTSVSFTGGIISVATPTTTPALTVAGTSGGIPYFSSGTTWASSAALTQYGVVYGGGAGATPVATAAGTTGQVLTATTGGAPTWASPATSGTVTSVSVVSANGFAGTVATATTTPAITLTTSITGVLKGNGTAISAAVVNTDYLAPSAPVTKTADFTVAATDVWLINNKTGSTCTVTLPTASSWTGRILRFQNYQVQTVVSASSNVVPLTGGAAGTSILLASSGDSATLVSDGTNWLMTQYIPNNILLLE